MSGPPSQGEKTCPHLRLHLPAPSDLSTPSSVECTMNEGSGLVRSTTSSPSNGVVDTGPLGGKQCRQPQLSDHKYNNLVVTMYTGITIQTLVLYYAVKRAGFTHAHRCVHKHTQILHSADRTRQLPTLRRVSSLNTISSCQLCAEQSYSFRCVWSSTLHHTTGNAVRDSQ